MHKYCIKNNPENILVAERLELAVSYANILELPSEKWGAVGLGNALSARRFSKAVVIISEDQIKENVDYINDILKLRCDKVHIITS